MGSQKPKTAECAPGDTVDSAYIFSVKFLENVASDTNIEKRKNEKLCLPCFRCKVKRKNETSHLKQGNGWVRIYSCVGGGLPTTTTTTTTTTSGGQVLADPMLLMELHQRGQQATHP